MLYVIYLSISFIISGMLYMTINLDRLKPQ